MSIKIWSSLLLFTCCYSGISQDFQHEVAFVKHLESRHNFEEGLLYIDLLSERFRAPLQKDTLNFFKGRMHYALKDMRLSISAFGAVSPAATYLWNHARFYSSLQFAYLGEYDRSLTSLNALQNLSGTKLRLQLIELAGIHLLKRDLDAFKNVFGQFDGAYFELKAHEDELMEMSRELSGYKRKSPLLAGILSGLVPGAGKFYVGKIGQGTMSLLTTGIFALQAYEGYRKDGAESPRFIIFSSLFSVFYVANIWGSVITAKIEHREFNDTIDETILVNMHIPLRKLYR